MHTTTKGNYNYPPKREVFCKFSFYFRGFYAGKLSWKCIVEKQIQRKLQLH